MKRLTKLLGVLLAMSATICIAAPNTIEQTKTKLKSLSLKITQLEKKLSQSKNKQQVLDKELSNTEKQISLTIKKLYTIRKQLHLTQEQVDTLTKRIHDISEKLHIEQQKMAKHLTTRYKMGEYQPLKWLLNQENPNDISQLLTYYQYLIRSQQQAISKVKALKHDLDENQASLNKELEEKITQEQAIIKKQHQLNGDKAYQANLISRLHKDIDTKQQQLSDYQVNKESLTKLLSQLARRNVMLTQVPFSRMRHKLPYPVKTRRNKIDKTNQGVMFFVKEGLPVGSVYPGKVVFSDWLKGYGLLIIVDHGRGYMTLYAHNQSLFKEKGELVEQGEQIATVGHSGGINKNGLYFEIRHRGKAVSPLDWLS